MRVALLLSLLLGGCAVQSEYSFVVSPKSMLPAGTDETISHGAFERIEWVAGHIEREIDQELNSARCRKGGTGSMTSGPVVFEIDGTEEVNAFYRDGHIRLTQGMVNYLRGDPEIAFVIGHELAHRLLHHTERPGPTRRKELEADSLALELVRVSGYDPKQAIGVLERLAHDQSQRHLGTGYPSYAERFLRLHEPQDSQIRNAASRFGICSLLEDEEGSSS